MKYLTQQEAEQELLSLSDDAMIPIGYADNLISKIYKGFGTLRSLGDNTSGDVLITKYEYYQLEIDSAKLQQLEINGVDNWCHYGCMCSENGEDECIFCTEDEIKYLDL